MIAQQIVNAIALGSAYALFAFGYTLVLGVLRILNFAHGTIYAVAALVGVWLVAAAGWPLVAAGVGAVVVAGLLGVLLDRAAFKPLRDRGAGLLPPMIASIGLAQVFVSVSRGLFGSNIRRFPRGSFPTTVVEIGPVRLDTIQISIIVVTVVLVFGLTWLLKRTRLGHAIRAVSENPRAARRLGIDVDRVIAVTLFLASGLGGLAGLFIGLSFNFIYPDMAGDLVLRGLAVIVLGGMGSIPGAVVGAFVLALFETFAVAYGGSFLRDAIAFTLLFLVLIVRPTGILGTRPAR